MALPKQRLGRGLEALLGEASVKESAQSSDAARPSPQTLPIEYLQRGKYQPRKDIDPEKLQELADSIKAQGIIQPIIVRKLDTDKYEIVAGERRWRAAQLAGLQDVSVIIRDIDDRATMAQTLIENIQREDLNPLEEAEALRRLLDEFGMTHQQIAESIGKSRVTVTNLLRLIDLQPEVKTLLLNRQLEMGHARALLGLNGSQQVNAAQKVAKEGLTVRATERMVKALLEQPQPSKEKTVDHDTLRLQNELTAHLGARVLIDHKDNGSGKLIINYTTLEELDGIISQIKPQSSVGDSYE